MKRRSLLASLLASPLAVRAAQTADPWRGLKLGVATYTFRKRPVEEAIAGIRRVGLHYASIKDAHMPVQSTAAERKAAADRFRQGGVTPLSCGNLDMTNEERSVRTLFEYARDAGIRTIVCTPQPDTIPLLDRMVKEFDIRAAIHNHGPGAEYASPYDVLRAVGKYDARIGLCIDIGHTARAGVDPAESIRKCRARLYDMHLKDLTSTKPDAGNVEIGRGALDFAAILRALLEIRYEHLIGIEWERDQQDPLPGLAESVGYLRGVIASLPGSKS